MTLAPAPEPKIPSAPLLRRPPLDPLLGVTRSLTGRSWSLLPRDDAAAGEIARRAGVDDLLAGILAARGIKAEDAAAFLSPRLRDSFPDPSRFTDMDKAAGLIWDALKADRRIALFADYDVDGASSAAQLGLWLRAVGAEPLFYVPDRIEEGYGPSAAAFETLKARGAELVVTLDCGAASHTALESAARIDLPVIVVDHHLMVGDPPPAAALVNPNQPGDASACGHLAAAGVAFVLLAALNREGRRRCAFANRPEPNLFDFAGLAALGTICDVVPLTGFNRALVGQGLKVLSAYASPGLAALAAAAGVSGPASVYHAGFLLGPRINAGGRLGASDLGVKLLTTQDPAVAARLAETLDRLNRERQGVEAEVLTAATAQIEAAGVSESDGVLIAAGEGWHAGVIGVVAGRLKERFNRPALVIGIDPETGVGKGSGRSVAGVNLGAAVQAAAAEGLLISGGGHPMAAGLSVAADGIAALADFLKPRLDAQWAGAEAARRLTADARLTPAAARFDAVAALERAGPYGPGWPAPRFVFPNLRRTYAKRIGSDHVRATLAAETGEGLSVIAFRCADGPLGAALLGASNAPLHALGRLKAEDNRFGKRVELQLEDLAWA